MTIINTNGLLMTLELFCNKIGPENEYGCWPWLASRTVCGYGQMWVNGKRQTAHRISYQLFVGPIPKGLAILHSCNRGHEGCVNPNHLRAGTLKQNSADMILAGNGKHQKLSPEQVWKIRDMISEGKRTMDIAAVFGIYPSAISSIKSGRTWAHLIKR